MISPFDSDPREGSGNVAPMTKHLVTASLALCFGLALDACVVRGSTGVYTPGYYGYSTYATPNTAYYGGGYHNRVYYPAGYYARTAPFVGGAVYAAPVQTTVYAAPAAYAPPVYAQPAYGQPVYAPPPAQPVYAPPVQPAVGVRVGGGVGVGGISAGGGVRVVVP